MSGDEPGRDHVPLDVVALEAIRPVVAEYGLPSSEMKPCIAYHLVGNLPLLIDRHKIAFTLAMELRRVGLEQEQVERHLARWANKIDYPQRQAQRAAKSAFMKRSDGGWRWHPPGLKKRPGTIYYETLGPICEAVSCPANCPAFAGKYQGPVRETFERFEQRGWPLHLRRRRMRAAIDVYRSLCQREKQLGLAAGVELLLSYDKQAVLAGCHRTTVGKALRQLAAEGLVLFEPGSGSGPSARDRKPSRVRRVVPIPLAPGSGSSNSAIQAGRGTRPDIGSRRRQGGASGNPR
jgi:hypothetical protein